MSINPTKYPGADALPFHAVGSFDVCNSGRQFPPRDFQILNYTTLETWKSLRLPKTRGRQDLSLFPSMHLDILLQVLSHLHPLDLLHLSRTSREFRDLLGSPPGELIWRNSFGGDPELPAPPKSIAALPNYQYVRKKAFEGQPRLPTPSKSIPSARTWTNLIYGPNLCDVRSYQSSPIHAHVASALYQVSTQIADVVREISCKHEIHTLIPKTCRTSGGDTVLGRSSTPEFDAEEARAILKMYKDHEAQNDPEALSQFLKSQRAIAADIKSAAFNCAFWARHRVLDVVETRNRDCLNKILKSVEKWLSREGWEAVDIQPASWRYRNANEVRHLRTIRTLTHRLWKRLRPYAVWYVERQRAPRLGKERNELCYRRQKSIQHAALNTLSEPVPGHNMFFPPPQE
ncbi:hypothetical protein FB45DRAFT_1082633 [Roridomyces roridus]|uniref:F-box domain-containing protein n=1 Tax=Roridomyces roridus TaxID=1738132 RepID=A0AAD7BQ76_9AGAR|nr:hypothetical protein FB45DRAFT_1082633 [Roridomyces roridus]